MEVLGIEEESVHGQLAWKRIITGPTTIKEIVVVAPSLSCLFRRYSPLMRSFYFSYPGVIMFLYLTYFHCISVSHLFSSLPPRILPHSYLVPKPGDAQSFPLSFHISTMSFFIFATSIFIPLSHLALLDFPHTPQWCTTFPFS